MMEKRNPDDIKSLIEPRQASEVLQWLAAADTAAEFRRRLLRVLEWMLTRVLEE